MALERAGGEVERGDDRVVHQRGGIACTQGRTHQELGRQGGRRAREAARDAGQAPVAGPHDQRIRMMVSRGATAGGSGAPPPPRCRARWYTPEPDRSTPLRLTASPPLAPGTSGKGRGKSVGSWPLSDW